MNPFVLDGIVAVLFFGAFVLLVLATCSKRKQDILDERNFQEERARILREIEVRKLEDKREMERTLALYKVRKNTVALEKKEPVPVRQTSRPLKPEAAKKSETRKVDDDDDFYTGRNAFVQQSSFNHVDDTTTQHNTYCAPEPSRGHSYSCHTPDSSSSYSSDSSSDSGGGGGGD